MSYFFSFIGLTFDTGINPLSPQIPHNIHVSVFISLSVFKLLPGGLILQFDACDSKSCKTGNLFKDLDYISYMLRYMIRMRDRSVCCWIFISFFIHRLPSFTTSSLNVIIGLSILFYLKEAFLCSIIKNMNLMKLFCYIKNFFPSQTIHFLFKSPKEW